jgi:hypothetical protein
MYRGISERERTILDVVLASLDQMAKTIRDLDENLATDTRKANGGDGESRPAQPKPHRSR